MTAFPRALLGVLAGGALLIALVLALVLAAGNPGARAFYAVPGPAQGGTLGPYSGGPVPGILASGDATVKVRPDIAVLTIGATAQAPTAAEAQAAVAERIARILQRAKDLKVADKDTKNSGYTINPLYASGPGQAVRITGYQAQQTLAITYRDVDATGKALDALVQNDGATNVSVRFAIEDPRPSQAEGRKLAIADARAKARAMADAAGVKLGKVVSVSEAGGSATGPLFDASRGLTGPAGPATQLPLSDLDVTTRVTMQFAID